MSQYIRVTERRQTDRQHLMTIAELAMELQRSLKQPNLVFLRHSV